MYSTLYIAASLAKITPQDLRVRYTQHTQQTHTPTRIHAHTSSPQPRAFLMRQMQPIACLSTIFRENILYIENTFYLGCSLALSHAPHVTDCVLARIPLPCLPCLSAPECVCMYVLVCVCVTDSVTPCSVPHASLYQRECV